MGTTTGRAVRWETRAALWVGGAFAAVVVGAALLAWVVVRAGDTEPVPWDKPAAVDGDVVRLTYLGSECRDGASVDVAEDAEQVVLTVRETVHARSCSDVGVTYEHEVRLAGPLDGRELTDGACLEQELARRPACR
jgi:hypothetical protein